MLNAMLKEIELRKNYLGGSPTIETIYFGGGTPSLLTHDELQQLLDAIHKHFNVVDNAEITLEANPDDLSQEKLIQLKNNSINRLSIGIQSFFDEDLQLLNRIHSGKEAKKAVLMSQDIGIDNITIDFIYAIPGLSNGRWKQNLKMGIELQVPHISAYCLTVEEKTPLEAFIKKGQIQPINEEQSIRHFEILLDTLTNAGFEHYEISNFAKPNYRSRHNSAYWHDVPYIGIGPSAHSFDGNTRQWNVAHNIKYANYIQNSEPYFEQETLTRENKINEYILTKLRLMEGVNLKSLEDQFGAEVKGQVLNSSSNWLASEHLLIEGEHIKLTRKGKFVVDRISSELFV